MKNEYELVVEVLEGNQGSFEILLQPYRKGILNMAYRMTGNIEEAKEVCQETLIKIYRHLDKFKKEKSLKNWIYTITMNSTYDYLRGKKKYKDLVEKHKSLPVNTGLNPEKKLMNKEIKTKIDACLKTLSPKEKSVFLLRDGEGFSIKETSGILGCSSMSVRTHLSRARQKIRKQFEKIYPFRYGEVKQ